MQKKVFVVYLSFFVTFAVSVVLAQKEECFIKDDTRWTIDCEDMEAIDGDFLTHVQDTTFKDYTIEVKNCSAVPETKFNYTLSKDYVWNLRMELYTLYAPKIRECRMNVAVSKEDYYRCLTEVRKLMHDAVLSWTTKITMELILIKRQIEKNCNKML